MKLSYGLPDLFDQAGTNRAMREYIIQRRRDGDLTKERAREVYDSWCEFATDGYDGGSVYSWGSEQEIESVWEILRYERHGIARFMEHMPHLANALRVELAAEAAAAPPPAAV